MTVSTEGVDPKAGTAAPRLMSSRARMRLQHWQAPIVLAALLGSIQAAGLRGAFEYRRAAVLQGQVWRLLTGNLVHLGWVHLARNIAGLFLIWGLLTQSLSPRSRLWILCASGAAVGLGLLFFSPMIEWYVGISGALFGLFCAGALTQLQARPVRAGALLLGMAAIIGWTMCAGALPGETKGLGGSIVPQAHLYGALGGAAFILMREALRAGHQAGRSPRD